MKGRMFLSLLMIVAGITSAYADSAPVLSVSGDRVVVVGDTLRFTVTASDADREDRIIWIRGRGGPRFWETNRRLGDSEIELYSAAGFSTNPASGDFVLATREADLPVTYPWYPPPTTGVRGSKFSVPFYTISSGRSGSISVETKIDFLITEKRLSADFGASALWGEAPLTVNFTSLVEGYYNRFGCDESSFLRSDYCPTYRSMP